MTQETVTFAEIVSQLKSICNGKKTGTMFITSQLNRSAQIMVENGSIVYLYYFNKRGHDALMLLPEIQSGRYRFQEGSIPSMRTPSLVTDDVLRYLSAASGELEEASNSPVEVSNRTEQKSAVMVSLSDEQKRILEEGLAIYIGPMASFICEDHLEKAGDVVSAIERLAAEIPEEGQAKSFSAEMLQRLTG